MTIAEATAAVATSEFSTRWLSRGALTASAGLEGDAERFVDKILVADVFDPAYPADWIMALAGTPGCGE